MLAPETDYVRLSYRPDLQLLFLRWTRPATANEHRAGYEAALQLARQEQAGRWLVDLRSRGLAAPEDLLWVLREFWADFHAALPSISKRIAYLATPYHADILRPRLQELNSASPTEMEVRVFTEELSAQQWLQSS